MVHTPEKSTTSDKDCWRTPNDIFQPLNKAYNFRYDLAADFYNRKALAYYSAEHSFLESQGVLGNCWLNPPFSKATEFFKKVVELDLRVIAIFRCDNMETKVWQEVILPNCEWIFIPKGRVQFLNPGGSKSKNVIFPSAIISFNLREPEDIGIPGSYLVMSSYN